MPTRNILPGRVAALLVLILVPLAASAGELTYVDSAQWTFNNDCAAEGNLITTCMPYGAQIWDATDPANMVMLSDIYFHGKSAIRIEMSGDLLAVTTSDGRMRLFDISDPANPTQENELTGFGVLADLIIENRPEGRIAFVAGSTGLKILNLDDPASPVTLDENNLPGDPVSVMSRGDTLAILSDDAGLQMVDVSDLSNSVLLGTCPISDSRFFNVAIEGDIAATSHRQNGVRIFDVSNPAAIDSVYHFEPAMTPDMLCIDVFIKDGLLYVTTDLEGVAVYDLAVPSAPALVGYDAEIYHSTDESCMVGDFIYMTHWGWSKDGIHVIDVSDPANPTSLGHTSAWDFTRWSEVVGDYVYTNMGHMGTFVHEYIEGTGFELRGDIYVYNNWCTEAHEGLIYIGSEAEGLTVVDWSDPASPIRHDNINQGVNRGIVVREGIAYCAVYREGLVTVDVSDPDNLVLLKEQGHAGGNLNSIGVDISGNVAVTADRDDGMRLYDITDPAAFTLEGQFPVGNRAYGVVMNGTLAYLAAGYDGTYVIDVSDPANPVQLDLLPGVAQGVDVDGIYLHVAEDGSGVTSYRLDDPEHPVEIATYNTTGDAAAVVGDGSRIFVSDHSALLLLELYDDTPVALAYFRAEAAAGAVDLAWELSPGSDPAEFRLEAELAGDTWEPAFIEPLPGSYSARDTDPRLAAGGDATYRLYMREGGAWLLVRSATVELPAATAAVILRAHPNPFNPATTLLFDLPRAGQARLALYDPSGRRVALLHEGALEAGPAFFEWDGRDDRGRELAGGVYLANLVFEGGSRQVKLVMIR